MEVIEIAFNDRPSAAPVDSGAQVKVGGNVSWSRESLYRILQFLTPIGCGDLSRSVRWETL
jgi:hypothetical protein